MSGLRSLPIDEILERGTIGLTDILQLRRVFYEDGIIAADEAELLFAMNDACKSYHHEWPEFLIEAITDYIVFQEAPRGYLTAANARWLIDRVSNDGKIDRKSELDLIVNVLDKARWAPVSLVKFALEQVKLAVLDGTGPLRDGRGVPAGSISEAEVDLLRRMLYAFAGDGSVAVTRAEADVLFDIDEAISGGAPNPAWTDLFVKAVANVMMAASGYAVPSREEALRHEAALERPEEETSVLAALLSMVQSNLASVQDAYHDQTAEERALARLEHQRIEIITHEEITEAEATWLVSRLGRNGRLSPSEQALVSYMNRESPKIHPVLTEAVCRLGDAA